MKQILKFTSLVLFAFLVSCGGKESQGTLEGDLAKVMTKTGGDFRGLSLNSSKEDVLKVMGKEDLYDDSGSFLNYSKEIDPKKGFSYDLLLEFDKFGLMSAELNTYYKNDKDLKGSIEKGHKLFNDFISFFNEKYGTPIRKEKNYVVWEFKAKNGGNKSNVVLDDYSDKKGFGYVRVRVYALE